MIRLAAANSPTLQPKAALTVLDARQAWSARVRVYRLNAADKEARVVVLGTADTANQALQHLLEAIAVYPRVWVTDESDSDIPMAELIRLSQQEQGGT